MILCLSLWVNALKMNVRPNPLSVSKPSNITEQMFHELFLFFLICIKLSNIYLRALYRERKAIKVCLRCLKAQKMSSIKCIYCLHRSSSLVTVMFVQRSSPPQVTEDMLPPVSLQTADHHRTSCFPSSCTNNTDNWMEKFFVFAHWFSL